MSTQESTTEETEEQQTRAQLQCNTISLSEVIAWVLVIILTVLFTGLLSANVLVLWLYKMRQKRAMEGRESKCAMEGNPCYETIAVKQTTDTHLYEAVRGGGAK